MTGSIDRRGFLLGLAAAGLIPAMPASAAAGTLAGAARASGLFFGSAMTTRQLDAGDAYTALLLDECDVWTPEWELKWGEIETDPGSRDYWRPDRIADWAEAAGKRLRGHTLVWHGNVPDWAETLSTSADWNRRVLPWLEATLSRFSGRMAHWDVVNEPIKVDDGLPGGLRGSLFHTMRGPGYIGEAFHLASERDPSARLYLNEYGLSYAEPWQEERRVALLGLLERLVADGVPVHGLGIQAHLDTADRFDAAAFARFLADVASLGLEITITELDVTETGNSTLARPERLQRVAAEAARYLAVALDQPAVRGVVTWSLSDRHSWLRTHQDAPGNLGLPFDEDYAPTPMYAAIREALLNAPARNG